MSLQNDIKLIQEMQADHARMIGSLTQRVNKLEKVAYASTLSLESDLTEMERILTGLEPEPNEAEASKRRAVGIGRLWTSIAQKTRGGEVVNVKAQNLRKILSREMNEDLSNKQVTRAMHMFVEMMSSGNQHKAEMMKGANRANQIVVSVPSNVYWTADEVKEQLDDLD